MGIKRIVDTDFWTDNKVDEDFTPEDKYFMLYLLTNPFTTQLGIYEMKIKQSAYYLGYSMETVKVLLDRFEHKYGLIKYSSKTKEVAIKNFLRHSIIKGGAPVRDCLVKELKKVKNKELIDWVFINIKDFENLNPTVANIISEYEEQNGVLYYSNEKQKDNEKDNDNENENENEVTYHVTLTIRSVVDYLNEKAKTSYRPTTKKTQDCIKARLNENFTLDDFKTVIDKKCADWMGDAKMEQYLRPETLFGTKFESYLNAKVTKKQPINTGVPVGDNQDDLDGLF